MKTEFRIQEDCYVWLNNSFPELRGLYFEIQNTAFSARSGMLHKAIGRQPGVADNCLLLPYPFRPIFFEFKTQHGRQNPEQLRWEKIVKAAKYKYYIVRTLEEFKTIIHEEYGNEKNC